MDRTCIRRVLVYLCAVDVIHHMKSRISPTHHNIRTNQYKHFATFRYYQCACDAERRTDTTFVRMYAIFLERWNGCYGNYCDDCSSERNSIR